VAQRNPEFNHYFWYDQHIGRFLGHTTGNDHRQPMAYYLVFLPLLIFPWSFFLPAAFVAALRNLRDIRNPKQQAVIYLLCGAGFITLFFSASSGKLLTYILPVLPMLALLMAAYFEWLFTRRTSWNRLLAGGVAVLALLLVLTGIAIATRAPEKLQQYGVAGTGALVVGVLLVVWSIALIAMTWRFRLKGMIITTAVGFAQVFMLTLPVVGDIANRFTTESLIAYVRPGLSARSEILTINHIQSIEFYTGRRVEIIGTPDEMQLGVAHMDDTERRKWIFNGPNKMDNVKEEMGDPDPVYVFVRIRAKQPGEIARLMREIGHGATPIMANERYLVFGNRAAARATPPLISPIRPVTAN
jgi:hypothetical protein